LTNIDNHNYNHNDDDCDDDDDDDDDNDDDDNNNNNQWRIFRISEKEGGNTFPYLPVLPPFSLPFLPFPLPLEVGPLKFS